MLASRCRAVTKVSVAHRHAPVAEGAAELGRDVRVGRRDQGGPASNRVTATPKSSKMEAIWQPVSAPPITATRSGRPASDRMSS